MYNEVVMAVVMRKASDVEGEWVAHCLNLDVMSQGASMDDAFKNIIEVISLTITDDCAHGLDPLERPEAPEADWLPFRRTWGRGRRWSSLTPKQREQVTLVCFQVAVQIPAQDDCVDEDSSPDRGDLVIPDAWQIAGYERLGSTPTPPGSSRH